MRLLIYTALFSAFFLSKSSHSTPEYISATPVDGGYDLCRGIRVGRGATGRCEQITLSQINPPDDSWSQAGSGTCEHSFVSQSKKSIICKKKYTKKEWIPSWERYHILTTFKEAVSIYETGPTETNFMCPNPLYENGPKELNGSYVCYLSSNLDPDCPTPNPDTDVFMSSVGEASRCFKNADGSICQYDYSKVSKGFSVSSYYANIKAEWFVCGQSDFIKEDPIVASVVDPQNLDPLPDNLYGPMALPDAASGDNSDSTIDIDALNQVNDNLASLISNNATFDAANFKQQHDSVAILKHLVAQDQVNTDITRNTNNILMPMSHNQAVQLAEARSTNDTLSLMLNSSENNRVATTASLDALTSAITDGGNGGGDGGGDTPCEGPDCNLCTGIECIDISTTQTGKQGGLASLFTSEDVLTVQTQIDEQLVTNKNELDAISTELGSMFSIDPSLVGGYEARTIEIKGEQIDISLRRYSEFFQMLSTPIMLAASITALFILLRER
ncbi:hypothetical protein N473_04695 [Pseudoalteromonas luteoviolacea CPMOR-1]|uniref:Uncharacterized protein n=1 Tax=Pseudoalteromonas luteoviolacea CPMOR-1 TaxID=1365248 RepID=A0A167I069_9GAMM|nr:hypothetical protein [Pseudoalteromonas luteoviolacea]KZN58736.1 hypothetical protein N473_04695 [Pseudoalteromonas luteoviolacea CPMOR-1]